MLKMPPPDGASAHASVPYASSYALRHESATAPAEFCTRICRRRHAAMRRWLPQRGVQAYALSGAGGATSASLPLRAWYMRSTSAALMILPRESPPTQHRPLLYSAADACCRVREDYDAVRAETCSHARRRGLAAACRDQCYAEIVTDIPRTFTAVTRRRLLPS